MNAQDPAARFPHLHFPDSWYAVAWAREVPSGIAVPLRAFGEDLVAFRKSDGAVQVLAAHCPHLGAHLGHGGTVVGDEVRCPFHGWQFDGSGRCTRAANARSVSQATALRAWVTRDLHNRIWIWFSNTDAPPNWDLPETLLNPDVRWKVAGRIDRSFPSHPQDVLENAADAEHFRFVHGMSEILSAETAYTEHGLATRLKARSKSDRLGFKGIVFNLDITARVYGMGLQTIHSVITHDRLPFSLSTIVIEGLVPREAGQVDLLIDIQMSALPVPGVDWLAHRSFRQAVVADVDSDIQIWAHRRYLARPQLVAVDTEIGGYRRWARRFYPQPSPGVTRVERVIPT
ncbi:MAG: Rieske family iron-sulfur cluster-binding protein [Myxococcaceae bacterium]|nr:Rieske family iron-sulfur cluster-binding protein [Myxococcaceae bacterium]